MKIKTTRKFRFRSEKPAPLKKKNTRSISDSIKDSGRAVKYRLGGEQRLVKTAIKSLINRRKI